MSKPSPRTLWSATAFTLAVLLLLGISACHNSSSGGGGVPAGFAVMASPPGPTFVGPTTMVTLTVTGKTDPNPVVHYTTDLSEPTDMSPVYAGPFPISATTVVKAIAINPDMTETDVMIKGYVLDDGPFTRQWAESGHGDLAGEPFRHWDEDGEVQTSCARCHGDGGLKDYLLDGTVDVPAERLLGLNCEVCHQQAPLTVYDWKASYPFLATVDFPSADNVDLFNASNICIACHQGRESGQSVEDDIAGPGPYTFINIHYYAAGASYFGSEVEGGYQYDGNDYASRNSFASHEVAQRDCIGCHMRGDMKDHTFEPKVEDCTTCHAGTSFETLSGSPSINYQAIQASQPQLLAAIQDYGKNTLGFPIAYSPTNYPYFVFDVNDNGVADPDEASFGNRYDEFDATLLKAAYNYQAVAKEPAGYIHNGVYMRQLLHDSLEDLGVVPEVPAPGRDGFDPDLANKSEQWHLSGHSDSTAEAFRHWDEDGAVSQSCAKCHSSSGFRDYAVDSMTDAEAPLGQTIECKACHSNTNLFADASTLYDDPFTNTAMEPVTFPSGLTGTLNDASNMCMNCHQGRESGLSIDDRTPNTVEQAPTDYDSYDFVNRHYYAAGAILFGSDVKASYEYAGASYQGRNLYPGHMGEKDSCLSCHMRDKADHGFLPQIADCVDCHTGITEFEELGRPFGLANVDYDADGTGESFDSEILGLADNLYTAIQAYAMTGLDQASPIIYSGTSYPYFFKDTNGDGLVSPGEAIFPNRYRDFDLELLRAAFNYHSAQDPCGDIHNFKYVLQSVYDSADMLDDGMLNLSATGTRP